MSRQRFVKIGDNGAPDSDAFYSDVNRTTASGANAVIDGLTTELLRSTSSRRYKRDIEPLTLADVRGVLSLAPVRYRSESPADDPGRVYVGLVAEDVAEDVAAVCPQLVTYTAEGEPDAVQYDRVAVLALLVVQDLVRELAALGQRIAALEASRGAS